MTPFRKSQARAVIEAVVRGLAPTTACSLRSLQQAVRSVAEDPKLWAELAALPPMRGTATMQTSSLMEPFDD